MDGQDTCFVAVKQAHGTAWGNGQLTKFGVEVLEVKVLGGGLLACKFLEKTDRCLAIFKLKQVWYTFDGLYRESESDKLTDVTSLSNTNRR